MDDKNASVVFTSGYYTNVRVAMNMTAISEKCEFGTIHYMTKVFKNEENISPTQFHRRFKNSHAVMLDAAPVSYYPDGIEDYINGGFFIYD